MAPFWGLLVQNPSQKGQEHHGTIPDPKNQEKAAKQNRKLRKSRKTMKIKIFQDFSLTPIPGYGGYMYSEDERPFRVGDHVTIEGGAEERSLSAVIVGKNGDGSFSVNSYWYPPRPKNP